MVSMAVPELVAACHAVLLHGQAECQVQALQSAPQVEPKLDTEPMTQHQKDDVVNNVHHLGKWLQNMVCCLHAFKPCIRVVFAPSFFAQAPFHKIRMRQGAFHMPLTTLTSHVHGSRIPRLFDASWVDRALEAASLFQSHALHGRCCNSCHRCIPLPFSSQDPRRHIAWSSPCHTLKGQWFLAQSPCAQMDKSCQANTRL